MTTTQSTDDVAPPSIEDLKREAWFRGNIKWKLHTTQRIINQQFVESNKQLFVANCSRQLGKSYWAVAIAVQTALQRSKAQIRYGAAFHTDLVEFIIPAFEKVMEDCPRSIKGKFKANGTSYVFPSGSKIKLVGLDRNPNGLRGNTLDLVVLDECGFVSNLDYLYKSIIIPATMHRPDAKVIMISTPPATPAHSFVDYCQKAETEGSYCKFTIFDNPLITEDTIKRLIDESGGIESTTWRREYMCEFVTDSDLAIIPEWNDKFMQEVEPDEFYSYYQKYVGLDLGVKDLTAGIFGYYDFKKASLIVEHEISMSGPSMNTELLANAIKAKEIEIWGEGPDDRPKVLPPNTPFRRVADNNWPMMILDFAHLHGLSFISTDKDSLEAMINEVRIMVQHGQIIINPRCVQTIGCLKYGVWDAKKKGFARSKVYGHFDHLAALIYLVRNLSKHYNPIPALHGHETHRSWTLNVDKDTHNTKVIKNLFTLKTQK